MLRGISRKLPVRSSAEWVRGIQRNPHAVRGEPRNIVGPQVRHIRNQLGLSQNEFAARCQVKGWDVTRDTICDIELQRRWVADFELVNLARHLQVPIDALWPAAVRRKLLLTRT